MLLLQLLDRPHSQAHIFHLIRHLQHLDLKHNVVLGSSIKMDNVYVQLQLKGHQTVILEIQVRISSIFILRVIQIHMKIPQLNILYEIVYFRAIRAQVPKFSLNPFLF